MAAVQTEMMPIVRDSVNPHSKSRYARLETIDREMRPIYTGHGFSVRYGSAPSPREGWLRITCVVSHVGGFSETNYLDAPPDDAGTKGIVNKTAVQGIGSVVSYLRRYLLLMVFNIVLADGDDDDGAARQGAWPARQPPPPRPAPAARDHDHPLEEPDNTVWLRNLSDAVITADTEAAVLAIQRHHSVRTALGKAPPGIREQIRRMLHTAHMRVQAADDDGPADYTPPDYPFVDADGVVHSHGTGSEWMALWQSGCERVEQLPPGQRAERMKVMMDLNRTSILMVKKFDPVAAAEVERMVNAVLEATT